MQDDETNVNSLLFMMATLSPQVRESLERESYRDSALPDESTESHILEDAFSNLMRDLNTLGLTFDIEPSDYTEDHRKLSMFIEVVKHLLPNTLYDIIKTDSRIRQLIENIVDGSIGEDNTFIQVYLIELAGLEGTLPIKEELVDFIDQLYPLVSQTEIFSQYFKNLVDLHYQERPSESTDHERHLAYREVVKNIVGDFSNTLNKFEEYEYFSTLLKIQKIFISDLLSPENFVEYSYIFLENESTLPVELTEGYFKKWEHYKVSHKWCYDYFKLRNLVPSLAEQVAIACFSYTLSIHTKSDYSSLMKEFRKEFPDNYKIDQKIFELIQENSRG